MPHVVTYPVRFADVDHATVLYYPKFFDYCHWAFEDYFATVADIPYHEVCDVMGIGFPTIHLESQYRGPLRFGDLAEITAYIREVGTSSLKLRYEFRRNGAGEPVMWCDCTTVCVNLQTWSPTPIPDELRGPLMQSQEDDADSLRASDRKTAIEP